MDVSRNVRREILRRFRGGCWGLGDGEGARRSESVPVARRASVEVKATTETCVAGEFDGGTPAEGGGYRVERIVPRLLMNASPGPVTRKKPAARSHIVGSIRKRRVSVFRSQVFLRRSSKECAVLVDMREAVSVAGSEGGGVRVP